MKQALEEMRSSGDREISVRACALTEEVIRKWEATVTRWLVDEQASDLSQAMERCGKTVSELQYLAASVRSTQLAAIDEEFLVPEELEDIEDLMESISRI